MTYRIELTKSIIILLRAGLMHMISRPGFYDHKRTDGLNSNLTPVEWIERMLGFLQDSRKPRHDFAQDQLRQMLRCLEHDSLVGRAKAFLDVLELMDRTVVAINDSGPSEDVAAIMDVCRKAGV